MMNGYSLAKVQLKLKNNGNKITKSEALYAK